MLSRTRSFERVQLGLLRALAGAMALLGAVWIRHGLIDSDNWVPWATYIGPALIAGGLIGLLLAVVPARSPDSQVVYHLMRLGQKILMATVLLAAATFFYRAESYSRASVILFFPLAMIAVWLADRAHVRMIRRIRRNDDAADRVLIVGYGDQARRLHDLFAVDPSCQEVVGHLDDLVAGTPAAMPVLGTTDDLQRVIDDRRVTKVAITTDSIDLARAQDLVGQCLAAGVNWVIVPPVLDLVLDRVRIEVVDGLPIVSERGYRMMGHEWYIKRWFDVAVGSVLLIFVSPVFLLAGLAVRVSSRGPIIYRQTRLGMNGRPFTLYKFRTMVEGVPIETHQDYTVGWIVGATGSEVASSNGMHKMQNDARVTRVGRVLRASSMDELPQLWNVLKGDMSLVGPRPPMPYEVEKYTDWHRRRLLVPPGVTGSWQVSGRNRLSFEEMVRLDIDYIERRTLGMDVKILLKTIPAVVTTRGS